MELITQIVIPHIQTMVFARHSAPSANLLEILTTSVCPIVKQVFGELLKQEDV